MVEIWPVIHLGNRDQALKCAGVAAGAHCPGVLLISMHGDDDAVDAYAPLVKRQYPSLKIGVNYLSLTAPYALVRSQSHNYDATWTDRQEFTRGELSQDARGMISILRPGHKFFTAVAFKGQSPDPFPGDSAKLAAHFGLIPTTSGAGTGIAPEIGKLERIRRSLHPADPLAVASGITPENVAEFVPFVTHILVATGISKSFYEFDYDRLSLLMNNAGQH